MTYYVIDRDAGEQLGCLDAEDGGEIEYEATEEEVAAAAESSHESRDAALGAALDTNDNRWIIDPDGNTEWVGCAR